MSLCFLDCLWVCLQSLLKLNLYIEDNMCASQCYIVTLPNGIDRRHVVSHLFVCSDWSWLSSVLEQVFDSTREITRSSSKIKYQHLYRHADSSVAAESNMVFYYRSSWLKGTNSLGLAYHYSSIKKKPVFRSMLDRSRCTVVAISSANYSQLNPWHGGSTELLLSGKCFPNDLYSPLLLLGFFHLLLILEPCNWQPVQARSSLKHGTLLQLCLLHLHSSQALN